VISVTPENLWLRRVYLASVFLHGGSDPDSEVSVRHHSIFDVVLNVQSVCITQEKRITRGITGEVSEGKSISISGLI